MNPQSNRAELFGTGFGLGGSSQAAQFGAQTSARFCDTRTGDGGASNTARRQQMPQASRAGPVTRGGGGPSSGPYGSGDGDPDYLDYSDDESIVSADTITGALAFQESSREDRGLTTTYTLPGVRTLAPSHLKRQHLIADLSLTSIALSYILIPKLRPAAFLKARIRNTSQVTLLRGRANLTLDGTFLGNTTIPRASPDETFTLLLGIDPAIHVTYAKPTVRRSSSGIFNKEESVVYSRAITIINNKQQKEPVELVVLDQIPVSEDEQLRMVVVQPAGLKAVGDKARTGEGSSSTASGPALFSTANTGTRASVVGGSGAGSTNHVAAAGQWGKAIATLKKDGEIMWNVTLHRGARCRLPLEYEARIPSSEVIVGIN